jgi:hypothetical protein
LRKLIFIEACTRDPTTGPSLENYRLILSFLSMKEYALACLAGIWLADGTALLIAPRFVISHVGEAARQTPAIFRWEILSILGGGALMFFGSDLPLRLLWIVTGLCIVIKGFFLWLAPERLRGPLVDWCLTREDVDYRFWGLGLCTLAVLLLHGLGWIGHS